MIICIILHCILTSSTGSRGPWDEIRSVLLQPLKRRLPIFIASPRRIGVLLWRNEINGEGLLHDGWNRDVITPPVFIIKFFPVIYLDRCMSNAQQGIIIFCLGAWTPPFKSRDTEGALLFVLFVCLAVDCAHYSNVMSKCVCQVKFHLAVIGWLATAVSGGGF